jgi:hypothetical protein
LKSAPVETDEDVRLARFRQIPPNSNIPATTTSLIARAKEIADIRKYLSHNDIRLVTLIGPPGIGKTRLEHRSRACMALAVISLMVFSSSPGSIRQPKSDSPVTIAQVSGLCGGKQICTVEEQLKEGIGDRHMLIVMDNCEHLDRRRIAPLAFFLLSACSFDDPCHQPGSAAYPRRMDVSPSRHSRSPNENSCSMWKALHYVSLR